jgi:hypothetical protein
MQIPIRHSVNNSLVALRDIRRWKMHHRAAEMLTSISQNTPVNRTAIDKLEILHKRIINLDEIIVQIESFSQERPEYFGRMQEIVRLLKTARKLCADRYTAIVNFIEFALDN